MNTKDAKVESFSAVAKKRTKKRRRVGQTCMGSNLSMITHPKNGSGISTESKKFLPWMASHLRSRIYVALAAKEA